jgi:hypothetical protein
LRIAARAFLADLQQELAVLGELQDLRVRAAIAANPDIAFVVDENAVVGIGPFKSFARSAPVAQEGCLPDRIPAPAARLAAFTGLQFQWLFVVGESGRAAMNDPDVVVRVDKTPIVDPSTQWFGSGLGHSGSTSKRGAIMPVDCAATVLSSTACPMPSAARSETNPAPIKRFFRERVSFFRVPMSPPAFMCCSAPSCC